jgi:hypothetical protein
MPPHLGGAATLIRVAKGQQLVPRSRHEGVRALESPAHDVGETWCRRNSAVAERLTTPLECQGAIRADIKNSCARFMRQWPVVGAKKVLP